VSAPFFLVDALPAGDTATLDGPEGHHAADVQRLRQGERLVLTDGRGATATAEVTAVAKGSVSCVVIDRSFRERPPTTITVLQGIPKGDRGELAVQAMTEVGVDEIVPWAASRSIAQWRGDRGHKARAKWAATAREAAKQARRAYLPVVSGDPDVTTKQAAARLSAAAAAFVLHEAAAAPLTAADLPATGEIILVVGPEGGIADAELDVFLDAGATAVRLGDTVLRTSTAGVAAIAVLATRLRRW
jgi:16S rRNA (uracil1498-N3)-methyltransferase